MQSPECKEAPARLGCIYITYTCGLIVPIFYVKKRNIETFHFFSFSSYFSDASTKYSQLHFYPQSMS